jgi:outer membrane biosynthesis protein TonB
VILRSGRDGLPRRRRSVVGPVLFALCSLFAHVAALGVLVWFGPPGFFQTKAAGRDAAAFLLVNLDEPEVPPEPPPDPEPEWDGQIVEIAPPKVEEKPLESDYLSRYDQKVEKETRSARVDINPEVLSPQWSKEQKIEQEAAEDLQVDKPSTGATVGNHRFDPGTDGTLASLPSPWERTNKQGLQDPIPGGAKTSMLAGAPQNDLLEEELGDRVGLNTTSYPYAGYLERIRRQVNYWWEQNLDNLPSSVRLSRSQYTSGVEVVLDADGALEHIEVTTASGVVELDDCVVRAFRLASPFENPPAGLVKPDGRVYLPDFDFTVQLSAAKMHYEGVDPRAGVQFPGILKAPR